MSIPVNQKLDFGNARRAINLAPAEANGEPVVYEQLKAAIEGIAWKDDVRFASTVNITVASPGSSFDGGTAAVNDRILLKSQTSAIENGIYIWNGAAVPMTRASDGSDFAELEGAVTTATEGTANAGTSWRQTQVNGVVGVNNLVWTAFGTVAAAASETTAGIAEVATQAETDAGALDTHFITPLKLANWSLRPKRFSNTYGDAAATSIVVTHNLNTDDTEVYVREATGSKRQILCEVQHTSVNSVTLIFDSAPALNSIRCTVLA